MSARSANKNDEREIVFPRGGFDVDRSSIFPVYIQLAEQIRYLIATAALTPGALLPPTRYLAQNLGVSRNTLENAYKLLIQEGLLETRGGGGTRVAAGARTIRGRIDDGLLKSVEAVVERARTAGLSIEELTSLVASRYRTLGAGPTVKVGLVECNPSAAEYFTGELRRALGVEVRSLMLDDLRGPGAGELLEEFDVIVTVFYHFAEVRKLLREAGPSTPEVVAITMQPHLSVVNELSKLPKGTRLGVIYPAEDWHAAERVRRMEATILKTGLKNIKVQSLCIEPGVGPSAFEGLDALLVLSDHMSFFKDRMPAGLPVVEFRNTLDEASIHMLREVIGDMKPRGLAPKS
ncbi:MAG: GntR family transcriptional regulator [Thermodesulfobacteriota bacterium]